MNRISNNSKLKSFSILNWFDDNINYVPENVFGKIEFTYINIGGNKKSSNIKSISPKAFLNTGTNRNNATQSILWKNLNLSLHSLAENACSQFESLFAFYYSDNFDPEFFNKKLFFNKNLKTIKKETNSGNSISSKDFKPCKNRDILYLSFESILIKRIESFFSKWILHSSKTYDTLTIRFSNSQIEIIEQVAFSRITSLAYLYLSFENKTKIEFIDSTSFLDTNATKTTIQICHPYLLAAHEKAFRNFFDEKESNLIELWIEPGQHFECNCSYQWLHNVWHSYEKQIKFGQSEFICQNGVLFKDLKSEYFNFCK